MRHLSLFLLFCTSLLQAQTTEITLKQGLVITQSCKIKPGEYALAGNASDRFPEGGIPTTLKPVVLINGNDLVIDFQDAQLIGNNDPTHPDLFSGVAIVIKGRNITLKNARAKGYKVALLANGVENLFLENCDFSYNYRPHLRSVREREDFSDWLSYHQNEKDEWLRYGAAIYLKNCNKAIVKACRTTGCQNALLLTGCNDGLMYNNIFQYNSGLGIGLYRSSRNRVMHNKLDWNVRGFSFGFYARGQDSAGILVYEQSNGNSFFYNSATHSGDGFFLWAGQQTMDTGEGGCNDNYLFGNDFSYAPTNGVEMTFSRNRVQGNLMRGCTYGIWGGYSYNSMITGNLMADCKTGLAIEHGQNDTIMQNFFGDDTVAIRLWANAKQPADWVYAQKRDTKSRDYLIDRNVFLDVHKPLQISASQNISINGENLFANFDALLEAEKPNAGLKFIRNDIYAPAAKIENLWLHPELNKQRNLNFSHADKKPDNPYSPLEIPYVALHEPDSLKDGILAALPYDFPQGRSWIVVGEWGAYDFRRPIAIFKEILQDKNDELPLYVYTLYGPPGKWRIARKEGVGYISDTIGDRPIELSFYPRSKETPSMYLDLEFVGDGVTWSEFGEKIPAGKPQHFYIREFLQKLDWTVNLYNYDDANDPLKNPNAIANLEKQTPTAVLHNQDLYYAWWDKPAAGVQEDRFVSISTAQIDLHGKFKIQLSSDDGARLYLDGKLLIDNWDIHEPETDEISVDLHGKHTLRVEHFDAQGFSTIGLRIEELRN